MAGLFYMALRGVGPWDRAMTDAVAQLAPYHKYFETARRAAEARTPMLAWRVASAAEHSAIEKRCKERIDQQARRANEARRRRDRHVPTASQGHWVVLEAPAGCPDVDDETFEQFLDAREVYDQPGCARDTRIAALDYDREVRALLLERLPDSVDEGGGADDSESPSPRLRLPPDTYVLNRQRDALRALENRPLPHLAPLVRLLTTRAQWDRVDPVTLSEDDWRFLRPAKDGTLRDGTDEQRRFVSLALGTPDFAILEGPPGSGKTTAISELIVQLVRRGKRVLLVASTHVAVDNVLERLLAWQDRVPADEKLILPVRIGEEARVTSDAVAPWTFGRLLRTWCDELKDFLDSMPGAPAVGAAARRILRSALDEGCPEDSSVARLILESANLVCGTTIGILQHPAIKHSREDRADSLERGDSEPFDVMILDEASKTTFAEFLVPAVHARRWVIVGDVRQLSPYVEDAALADSLRGRLSEAQATAAVHAYLAEGRHGRRLLGSVVAVQSPEAAEFLRREAEARGVPYADLDAAHETALRGIDGAVPSLLGADLAFGSPESIRHFEHRLPVDLLGEGGPMPALPRRAAAQRAYLRESGEHLPEERPDWAAEVAWRLVRAYELRQNAAERGKYDEQIKALLPRTLDDRGCAWPGSVARPSGGPPSAREALLREIDTIRRVAMPSVLELLQKGFDRLLHWRDPVALTDGLPPAACWARMVSLTYQHRMHPHISAFPRLAFYTGSSDLWLGERAAEPEEPPTYEAEALGGEPALLRDARSMKQDRAWSYQRHKRRAVWVEVAPRRGPGDRADINRAEAEAVFDEVDAFVAWAMQNPRRDEEGGARPWEVAILPFYRGQEALLREELQRRSGQAGNARTFRFGRDGNDVVVTLCTVDRFQGHEADLVVLSFVKSGSVGFLNSPNRLNVALTRARYQLVLIGHRSYFRQCRSELLRSLAGDPAYGSDITWESAQ